MSLVLETKTYKYGVIDQISASSIPRGAASSSLNWLTMGDWIELRRGSLYLGNASLQNGNGKASAIKKVVDSNGTEHLVGTYGQKAVYFDIPTGEWIEISALNPTVANNILGPKVVDGNGIASEMLSIEEYVGLAGNQLFINSPNCAGFFKIMTANLGTAVNMLDPEKNFNGNIKIDNNRTMLWGRTTDQTGIYGSWVDAQLYTTVANENGAYTGDGVTKTFSGTPLTEAGVSAQTVFAVQAFGQIATAITISAISMASPFATITASGHGLAVGDHIFIYNVSGMTQINNLIGIVQSVTDANNVVVNIDTSGFSAYTSSGSAYKVEVFTDDYAGTLTSQLGGTGTINYATGANSLIFKNAPTNAGSIGFNYQWETSNNNGITDFTKKEVMNVRVPGSGFYFPQAEGGGAMQNIKVYSSIYFCMHLKKTWELNIASDDSSATNLPYRQNVGSPSLLGSVETGNGIYYIDDTTQEAQRVRLLTYSVVGSSQIIPVAISNNIKIDEYLFDQAAGVEWGDYVLFAVRTQDSPVNNRILAYNKIWKSWDVLDYAASCFDIYNGTLVAGDSVSNNFQTLFSGFDDNGDTYPNYWVGILDSILLPGLRGPRKFLLNGTKKCYKFYLRGNIQSAQKIMVEVAFDDGDFIEIGGSDVANADGSVTHHYAIEGTSTYVDGSRPVDIGGQTLGTQDIGGIPASVSPTVTASPYERLFLMEQPEDGFEFAQIRYTAVGIGYVSVQSQKWWDVRLMGTRAPQKYTDRM